MTDSAYQTLNVIRQTDINQHAKHEQTLML